MPRKTRYPRRNKARVARLRAECARILAVPFPKEAVTEDELYRTARKLRISRMLPKRT